MTQRLGQQEQEQKVQEDIVSRELVLTALTKEGLEYKRRLQDKEQELARLRREVQERQGVEEENEGLLKEAMKEKTQLSDQITHVSLAKDALKDESEHLREEVAKLREQEEVAKLHVANITQGIEQLVSRLASRDREVADLRLRAEFLEGEVGRLEGVAENWKLVANGKEDMARELQEELVVEKRGARERLGKEVATSSVLQAKVAKLTNRLEEVGEQKTAKDSLALEVAGLKVEKELLEKEVILLRTMAWSTNEVVEGLNGKVARLEKEKEAMMVETEVLMKKMAGLEAEVQVVRLHEVDGVNNEAEQELKAREVQVQEFDVPACSTSIGDLLVKGEEATLVISRQDHPQVSPSTSPRVSITRASQARDITPPSASSTDSLQSSLKRPVDLEADSDYQKKARKNICTEGRHLQVSSCVTGQGAGSPKMESDMSMQVEGGKERMQVCSSNQYSRDLEVEEEALSIEREERSSKALGSRTKEGAETSSSPLQTLELEHVCNGCLSVFTQAASLHLHQAVAGRCRMVKEPEPQEFVCHRCFKQFNSKSHWSKHVSFVPDCSDKKQPRKDKVMDEDVVGLLEVQGAGEELCQGPCAEVVSALEVLPAGSPVSLPGLEVTESPVGDHCYALSCTLAPEQQQSSHNPGRPVQVNSCL